MFMLGSYSMSITGLSVSIKIRHAVIIKWSHMLCTLHITAFLILVNNLENNI